MGTKGKKSKRGLSETKWDEPKTERLNLRVTPTCKMLLESKSWRENKSITELIEIFARENKSQVEAELR